METNDTRKRWHRARNAGILPDAEDAAYMAGDGAVGEKACGGDGTKGAADTACADDTDEARALEGANAAGSIGSGASGEGLGASLAAQRMERWLADMERLRLAEYVRYVDDRKRLFWSSFIGGMARGVGMAVGFTILGAVLVLILQDLAKHNLPVIGDFLAQIVSVVQKRLE